MATTPAEPPPADEQPAVELPAKIDPVEEFLRPRLITHETKALEPDSEGIERRTKRP